MVTALIVTFIFLRVVRFRQKLHNGMQPLRNKKQYQVKEIKEVFTTFFVLRKKRKIKRLFPSTATCVIAEYDGLNDKTKGVSFVLHKVHFREIPVVGKVYTAKRKSKFARAFFEEKKGEQNK